MKSKIFTFIAIFIIALLYYFSISAFKKANGLIKSENAESMTLYIRDTFTNCIFNSSFQEVCGWGLGPQLHVARNLNKYKELNFNAVHQYDERGSEVYGWDSLPVLSHQQINNYQWFLDSVKNDTLYGFFERSFLSKYCYGQRLIYEVPEHQNDETTNYGFVYSSSECGNHETDQGRTVIHAVPNTHNEGNLCYDIYENLQHTDLFNFRQNERGTWYIKPVMKIPVGMPDNIPVVRIDVFSFDSTLVKQIFINTNNFHDVGSYQGNYIEKYFYLTQPLDIPGKDSLASLNKGRGTDTGWQNWNTRCHIDFRVHWLGQCEVWFDKMIVDDKIADNMFDASNQAGINYRINQEVTNFTNHGGLYTFFTDEVHISQVSCIKYIADKMRQNNPPPRFSIAVTNNVDIMGLKHDLVGFKIYLDSIKPDFFQDDHHGIDQINPGIPYSIPPQNLDPKIPGSWRTSNYDYNQKLQNIVLGGKDDSPVDNYVGSLLYEIQRVRNVLPIDKSIKFIIQPQIQGLIRPDSNGYYDWGNREPLNEEIQVQAMVSIAHGVNGLCWYEYNSFTGDPIQMGLLNPVDRISKRTLNCYGQNKWQYVSDMNKKIKNWMPVLENLNWLEGFSVHQNTANHYFIEDIKSIFRDNSNVFRDDPQCLNCDAVKYWEEGFFNPKDPSDKSKYVLMVNRRCVPDEPYGAGDIRMLKIKFKAQELQDFNNWKIIDVYNNSVITTFDKNTTEYIVAGEFQPGEGKLFKLAPVMQEGGSFVCNEDFGGLTVNCKGNVYSGGYNLNVRNNTTIEFNSDCGITVENCENVNFLGNGNSFINLQGKNQAKWNGITANNVSRGIVFCNTNFRNINYGWAVNIRNNYITVLQGNNFYLTDPEPGENLGALIVNNSSIPSERVYINNNYIQIKNVTAAIGIINSSQTGGEGFITYNNISTTENGRVGILLSNRCQETVENNIITGFAEGIHSYCSNLYLRNNNISSYKNESKGLYGSVWSMLELGYDNFNYYGGNTISNYGNNCRNIQIDNSRFLAWMGYNNYNVINNTGSYNLYGYGQLNPYSLSPTYSCFNGPSGSAIFDLKDTIGTQLYLYSELPHVCNVKPAEAVDFVLSLPFETKDTVYKLGEIINQNPSYCRLLYDNFKTNVLKGINDSAYIYGIELLSNFSDSVYVPEIVSKLYLITVADSNINKIQDLKTFYEQLIINHPQNLSVVFTSNYFIQKCKVFLKQYESALVGFEDIIQQNPYSFEGLIASWDYAATFLMIDTTLGGGGFSNKIESLELFTSTYEQDYLIDTLRIKRIQKYDKYDKSIFSPSDRKELIQKTGNLLIDERNKQIRRVNELQKEVTKGNNNKDTKAKRELEELRTLNEVVKVKYPKNNNEYSKIIKDDLNKIFKSNLLKDSKEITTIPVIYALYQNYPNPFNPVTKISFDLPKDSKVKLIVYDILGREITRLLNSEYRPAGKHVVEFNAVNFNLASGVYFYRIETDKFIAVKKMLMIK
jgi:hypothetical protein